MELSTLHLMNLLWGMLSPSAQIPFDYAPLENNAEFLIYEGTNTIGRCRVLDRTVPHKVKQPRK